MNTWVLWWWTKKQAVSVLLAFQGPMSAPFPCHKPVCYSHLVCWGEIARQAAYLQCRGLREVWALSATTTRMIFRQEGTSYCDLTQDPPWKRAQQSCVWMSVCMCLHVCAHVHCGVKWLLSGCVTQGRLGTHQKIPSGLPKTGFFLVPSSEGSERGSRWVEGVATDNH